MTTAKKQSPKKAAQPEMSVPDKMYAEACAALGRAPKSLDDFKAFYADDQKEAAYYYSLHRIARVVEARKAGHEFDWNDYDEYKHFPVFDMETYGEDRAGSGFAFYYSVFGHTLSLVCSRLSSKSEEDSDEIAKTMIDDYRVVFKG